MILLKSQLPKTSKSPVFHVFHPEDNALRSFYYDKWRATAYMSSLTGEEYCQRCPRHRFIKYLEWHRGKSGPSYFKDTSFVYTGDKVDMLKALHYVPLASTDELAPALTIDEIQALARQHGEYVRVPKDPTALTSEFQIIETFLARAMADIPTVMHWYDGHEVEDLLSAFTRYHLAGIGIQRQQHFDYDLMFLVCRKLGIRLGNDEARQYGSPNFKRSFRGQVLLPWRLPGTVLNHTRPYPSRFGYVPSSGFYQKIRAYDEASMIGV